MPEHLVSMKRSPGERESDEMPETSMASEELYPGGLSVLMGDEELDKLGIDDRLPEIGTEMVMMAHVRVDSVFEHKREGESTRRVTLQITDMGLQPRKETKSAAKALFGDDED